MPAMISCTQCGKPFQVADAAAGTNVICPWCKATVAAVPTAAAAPVEALSIEPIGPFPADLPPRPEADIPRPPTSRAFPFATLLILLVTVCAAFALTVVILRQGAGVIPERAWRPYVPPDNTFAIDLPGDPEADKLDPLPGIPGVAGAWYSTRGWYSGLTAFVGWRETRPGVPPPGAQGTLPELWLVYRRPIEAEIERQRAVWGGTVTQEATTRFDNPLTVDVRMSIPGGDVVERFVVAANPVSRIYFFGMKGKNVTPDSPAVTRLFNSFRAGPE